MHRQPTSSKHIPVESIRNRNGRTQNSGGEMNAQEFKEYKNELGQTLQDLQTNLWHYRDVKNKSWADYWRNKSLERLLIARLADLDATHAELAMVEMKIEMRNYKNGL